MNFLPVDLLAPVPSTNILITRSSARGAMVVAAFVALVFVGDIWLVKLTLPLSMFLLPAIFLIFRPYKLRSFPAGIFLLLGLLAIAALQIATGMSLDVKADTALWRPTLYAVATIFCLSAVILPDDQLKRAILVGGIATGTIMLIMVLLAPPDLYLVSGQNVSQTERMFQAQVQARIKSQQAASQSASANHDIEANSSSDPRLQPGGIGVQFSPDLSPQTKAFYSLKNKSRNLLGMSNYIAVFFVFVFTVAVFTGNRVIALLMVALVITTMSRFGVLCLITVAGCHFAYKRGIAASRISAGVLIAGAVAVAAFYAMSPYLHGIFESISTRLNFTRSAIDIASTHPLFGAPRSLVLSENALNIVWSPHSSILQLAVYFGLAGVALYAAYIWFVFRSMATLSKSSDLWAGILVGLSITFAWSLLEIIVITPAFEILVASLYALASRKLLPRPSGLKPPARS